MCGEHGQIVLMSGDGRQIDGDNRDIVFDNVDLGGVSFLDQYEKFNIQLTNGFIRMDTAAINSVQIFCRASWGQPNSTNTSKKPNNIVGQMTECNPGVAAGNQHGYTTHTGNPIVTINKSNTNRVEIHFDTLANIPAPPPQDNWYPPDCQMLNQAYVLIFDVTPVTNDANLAYPDYFKADSEARRYAHTGKSDLAGNVVHKALSDGKYWYKSDDPKPPFGK